MIKIVDKFPFPDVKYRQYKNTFLQNVFITFSFESNVSKEEAEINYKEYSKAFFGLGNNSNNICEGASITKKDMSLSYLFSTNNVSIFFNGQKYVSFSETAIPSIFKLRDYFSKVVKVNTLPKISIRKVNIWNIEKSSKEIDVDELMAAIFSRNLINELSTEDLKEEEKEIPHFRKAVWECDSRKVSIRTALMSPIKRNDNFYHLILDTQIDEEKEYHMDTICSDMLELNSVLFDVYHWCVSQSVLDIMK